MWPYLSENQKNFLAQELGKKMNERRLLIVGDFNYRSSAGIDKLLLKHGFLFYNNKPNSKIFNK